MEPKATQEEAREERYKSIGLGDDQVSSGLFVEGPPEEARFMGLEVLF